MDSLRVTKGRPFKMIIMEKTKNKPGQSAQRLTILLIIQSIETIYIYSNIIKSSN